MMNIWIHSFRLQEYSARVDRSSALGFVHTIGYGVLEDINDTIRVYIEETAVGVPFASLSGQYSMVGQRGRIERITHITLVMATWTWRFCVTCCITI